jgi:hypothetical protein
MVSQANRNRRVIGLLILLMANLFLAASAQLDVFAQTDLPLWRQNLDCGEREDQKREGVEYCTSSIGYHDGETKLPLDGTVTVQVVVIDLQAPGIKFEYVIAEGLIGDKNATKVAECNQDKVNLDGENQCIDVNRSTKNLGGPGCDDPQDSMLYPVMELEHAVDLAEKINASTAFVITSDYGARSGGDRDHGPEGLTVVQGCRLDGPAQGDGDNNVVKRPWLAISENPAAHAEFHQNFSDDGTKPYPWIYTGVGGAPRLILNGDVLETNIEYCLEAEPGSCRDEASQVAVGISQDNRWLFLVLAEEPPPDTNLLRDLAVFMREKLEVWQAIKFDGGGSSQLWYKDYPDNNGIVYREENRWLSQYLAVIAEPGTGIDVPRVGEGPPNEQGEESEDGLAAGWLEQIRKTWDEITQWIAELPSLPGRLWDQLINSLVEKATAWAEEKIQELITQTLPQCCMGAALPVGIVVLVAAQSRRRRSSLS